MPGKVAPIFATRMDIVWVEYAIATLVISERPALRPVVLLDSTITLLMAAAVPTVPRDTTSTNIQKVANCASHPVLNVQALLLIVWAANLSME